MQVGCLGDVLFSVSDDTVETINNFVWSGSARYSTHQRHLTHALTEFTGLNPDAVTLTSSYLPIWAPIRWQRW